MTRLNIRQKVKKREKVKRQLKKAGEESIEKNGW
jgi:hypothetical protein